MSSVSRYLEPALVEGLNQLQISARRVVEGTTTGHHASALKGASVEFRQHRFYVPGDSPRRLDWRVLARTDRTYVKEYDEETNLKCVFMLDASGSMGYAGERGSKFEYAGKLTAALTYLTLANTETVGLSLFSSKMDRWIAPRSGHGQLFRFIDALERATPAGESSPGRAMQESADRLGRRSLVVLVSDLLAPVASLRAGLARLGHDRHEVIVIRVLDPDEIHFPFRRYTRFRGLENEPARECDPVLARAAYIENFNRHARELDAMIRAGGAEFVTFTTDRPLIEALTSFLRRREMRGSAATGAAR
jgi:uncharacterized protein (DUF58 family)